MCDFCYLSEQSLILKELNVPSLFIATATFFSFLFVGAILQASLFFF